MTEIVLLTLRELVRRRFVLAAILATLALVALTGWGFFRLPFLTDRHHHLISTVEVKSIASVLVILIAYMFSFVLAFAATLIAAPSLASDVESGVLLPVLTRPISRTSVVVGKALGLIVLMCAYAGFAAGLEFVVVRWATGYIPPHPFLVVIYLALSTVAVLVLALALSSRLSMIASSVIAIGCFALARISGVASSLGNYYHTGWLQNVGTISQLIFPSDAMWRAANYRLEPVAMVAALHGRTWPGPFFVEAPPPPAMDAWTLLWIAAVIAIASRNFATRDV